MDFFDLVNISERDIELVNPTSPAKIIQFGRYLGLAEGNRVVDFGCGYAEPLVLWAEAYGIRGVGVELRPAACARARAKIAARGLDGRLEIVCAAGADHDVTPGSVDVATCIGASFIWGGFAPTIAAMAAMVGPDGRLGIGEPYWLHDDVPTAYADQLGDVHHEPELVAIARAAGLRLTGVVRAGHDDWDRYESANWQGLARWLAENPDHPERAAVLGHLETIQDDYLRYGRQHLGWAMYALARADSRRPSGKEKAR